MDETTTRRFKVGDRVLVRDTFGLYANRSGTVIKVIGEEFGLDYAVALDGWDVARLFSDDELEHENRS